MPNFQEYWDEKTGKVDTSFSKTYFNPCFSDDQCGSGMVCAGGICVSSPAQTGEEWCPVNDGGAWTDANGDPCNEDPECSCGIVTVGLNGERQCEPRNCEGTNTCPSGYTCVNGSCMTVGCTSNSECPDGYECRGGQCYSTTASCKQNSDCGPGYICAGGTCVVGCSTTRDCPEGTRCESGVDPDTGLVVKRCVSDESPGCDVACQTYFEENGQIGPGCVGGDTCGVCMKCTGSLTYYSLDRVSVGGGTTGISGINIFTSPLPYKQCVKDRSSCSCKAAEGGLKDECHYCDANDNVRRDCSCKVSKTYKTLSCNQCGLAFKNVTLQKSACLGTWYPAIRDFCAEQCKLNVPEAICDGECDVIIHVGGNYSCPEGHLCRHIDSILTTNLNGVVPADRYQECDLSKAPAWCRPENDTLYISVIDEDDGYPTSDKNDDWQLFRFRRPTSPFALLRYNSGNGNVSSPSGYDGIRATVGSSSNWASILRSQLSRVTNVSLRVDSSGSMTPADVQDSIDDFVEYCSDNGLPLAYSSEGNEYWIAWHL